MNELLFLSFTLFVFTLNLVAFKAGKNYLFALIAVYSLLMNIFVLKQFSIFGLMTAGGNELYAAVFLANNIISEHYGKKEAFKSVILGFLITTVFIVSTQFLLAFQPNEYDFAQAHLQALFFITPRILIGSLLAYVIAQFIDVVIYNYIKKITKNKFLFIRNNASTFVAQLFDTIIFTAVGMTNFAFLPWPGIFEPEQFWEIIFLAYILKIAVAAIDTPFLYLSYKFLPEDLKIKKNK